MSREIIEMAQEIAAQYNKAERFQTWTHDFMMQRLMELVTISAADEREACAKVCDDYDDEYDVHTRQTVEGIALQIRARSNT